jgi:hypothetical protein
VPVDRLEQHWLWRGGPTPPGTSAIALGRLVITRSLTPRPRLLRHEAVHVRQWRDLGAPRFAARYLGAYLLLRLRGHPHRAAYRRIPLEVEAEWVARRTGIGRTVTAGRAVEGS